MPPPPSFSPAFDAHAAAYDAVWTEHPLVRVLRARVLARCATEFRPGSRLLDLGCGTGADAAVLSALGYRVEGVDASAEMVARTRRRGVTANVVDLTMAGEETFGTEPGERWDGVYSNFGALNCLPTLRGLGNAMAAGLKPGARLVLAVMGEHCPAETLALAMRGRPRRRRDGAVPLGAGSVAVRYLAARTVAEEFGTAFRLTRVEALGALMPPPDLGGGVDWRARLEPWLARWPGVRAAGDHTLMVFRRA